MQWHAVHFISFVYYLPKFMIFSVSLVCAAIYYPVSGKMEANKYDLTTWAYYMHEKDGTAFGVLFENPYSDNPPTY